MKIALIGFGKMGRMIEKIALSRGHSIEAILNSSPWEAQRLERADVCIEFTHPDCVLENIRKVVEVQKPLVIGTTGWESQKNTIQTLIEKNRIGAVHAPNYSVGIYLFLQMLNHASKMMNAFPEYDVAGIEHHHKSKVDHPSGTANQIARLVENNMTRSEGMTFSSVRCGSIPGTHTVFFDSPVDTITISHQARNREGFAEGALLAAEWVQGKTGFFSFAECMQEWTTKRQHV